MRKILLVTQILFFVLILCLATSYAQSSEQGITEKGVEKTDQGTSSEQDAGWFHCPYCGHRIGPRAGHGMGPGIMHGRWAMGPYYGDQNYQEQKPLSVEQAKQILVNCLNYTGNPNLKLGKIEDNGSVFRADIVTKKEGALVDRVVINKYSGGVHSIY